MRSNTQGVEQVAYVGDDLYEDLARFSREANARIGESDPLLRPKAEQFVFREARLLDHRYYEEWLNLFDDKCIYWVPASPAPEDPRYETSIHLDDHRRLADRIELIRTGYLHAQTPPSRTRRMVSNVEAWKLGNDGIIVRSNFVIWGYRRNRMSHYVGWQEHKLIMDHSQMFRIKYRMLNLLDCDGAQGNITFIL